jgi:hypothetical protein
MRRIQGTTWNKALGMCGKTSREISMRDYCKMLAAIKTLESIAQTPSPHCARDPFLCKALARHAIDAFNAKPSQGRG